jgi:hypothetical protein
MTPDTQKQSKRAIQQEIKRLQVELKLAGKPKYPSERRKCKYCGCQFNTKPTYNGSKMKFCGTPHQKAFDKEGEKPIDVILRKQERRMREIAREEAHKVIDASVLRFQGTPKVDTEGTVYDSFSASPESINHRSR